METGCCYWASLVITLSVILLDLIAFPVAIAAAETQKCKVPASTVKWESNPDHKMVDVSWRYEKEYTCGTSNDCFGNVTWTHGQGYAIEGEGQNKAVPTQLNPVQLQMGNKLRFNLNHYGPIPDIYKVNVTGFHHCDTSLGKVVGRLSNVNSLYEVPSDLLEFGSNYFIVATDVSASIHCSLGLRLNATVKTETCTGNDEGVCGGHGHCLSNRQQPDYTCHCCEIYKGTNCSVPDVCLSYPCLNGGECLHHNSTRGYQCKCPIGYHGDHCEKKAESLCDIIKCQNGGNCTGNTESFNCTCAPGWTGSQCEVDIDDCKDSPCRHGKCVDKVNGHECLCYPGYHGQNCENHHSECSIRHHCKNGGFCENRTTSAVFQYKCHCRPGWDGTDCSSKTSPCNPDPCSRHGFCSSKTGDDWGYRCLCATGFSGHHCEVNMNDCDSNPCQYDGHCMDLDMGHLCTCRPMRAGPNCQYTQTRREWRGLEDVEARVVIVEDSDNNKTLYIVAGVLTTVFIIAVAVLIGCYCRIAPCGITALTPKDKRDLALQVDMDNTPDRPLTSDFFFQRSQTDGGVDNRAFKTDLV